jgi:hypothetical protein
MPAAVTCNLAGRGLLVTADQFAGDASAVESFEAALAAGKYTPEAFENHSDFFYPRHVAVIVVRVPTELIGSSLVHGWATVSLHGHEPDVQVARWGLPLITHLLIREPEMREDCNRSAPSGDNDRFTSHIAAVIRETTRLAGSAADPAAYSRRAVDKLGVMNLPYQLGTPASFDYAGFNGRGLDDDVIDVMLSLMTNSAFGDGVAPDPARIRAEFPYFRAA